MGLDDRGYMRGRRRADIRARQTGNGGQTATPRRGPCSPSRRAPRPLDATCDTLPGDSG